MKEKSSFSLQALIFCILFNGAMVAAYYFMAAYVFRGMEQRIDVLAAGGAQVSDLRAFVNQMRGYLDPALFGVAGLTTFILWLLVQFLGRRAVGRSRAPREGAVAEKPQKEKRAKKDEPARPTPEPAIQLLAILQRQGRFIDFLEEDLKLYDDAQIGAAVRNIHDGCKQALSEHVRLKPIYEQNEGAEVTIEPGFDAHAVRLTGNVTGNPPFRGALRHKGWKVVDIQLPQKVEGQEKRWILAPAEVEIDSR